jgi:hypothetical protein
MDPFLEDPDLFPDLHDSLIAYLREALQPGLPPSYFARFGRRTWVEVSRKYIQPDVQLHKHNGGPAPVQGGSEGGVAVAVRPQPVIVTVPHDERRETLVEIYVNKEQGVRLVTSIEVLSPTNKTPGEHGRDLYKRKQQEILESQVNLVEIDLLRGGHHTTAVALDRALEKTGPFDYHVCCHRFDQWEDYVVYPIRLQQPLPVIAIPLLPGDPDVSIDLQAVFNRSYDVGQYDREIRYRDNKPTPPLTPEQAQWATALLRSKGVLPSE